MSASRWWKGPAKAEPDFEQILKVLRREVPDRPTLFELFMNGPLYTKLAAGADVEPGSAEERIVAFRNAGYDYVTLSGSNFHFPRGTHASDQTISLNDGVVIRDRESFETLPWLDPAKADFAEIERAAATLPDGMKVIVIGPGGVLENVIELVGFDNLCFMLVDDPQLTTDVFDAVGSRLVGFYQSLITHDAVGAIFGNDDWGFKTQPMLAPDDMRRYVVPWHRKIVQVAHDAGKPAIMHSCGNLAVVMDDIIDDIGYDGKHSYEDTIIPVEAAYETWGSRIAILGGLDVDFVIRSTPEEVHQRAEAMLERVAERGGYALGTGNSVPEYIPDEQYFAMISAATDRR